jgi:hypothetical protein
VSLVCASCLSDPPPVSLGLCQQFLRILVGQESLQGYETLHGFLILRFSNQDLKVRAFGCLVLARLDQLPHILVPLRGVIHPRYSK